MVGLRDGACFYFQRGQQDHGFFSRLSANIRRGGEIPAYGWIVGGAPNGAAPRGQVQMDANLTGGFALRHAWDGAGDRGSDAADAAVCSTQHVIGLFA
jgi:hypothetical protein